MPGGLNPLLLGSIQYINSLPVDLGILSGKVFFQGKVIRGVPAQLNEHLLGAHVHVSPVSAFWYVLHQAQLLVLPDISISSESGVRSVLLFSRCAPRELSGKAIWVTNEGKSTPMLLEILCRKFYGFQPRLRTLPSFFTAPPDNGEAVLLIGDEALIQREQLINSGFLVTDLAEEWKRLTGLGFVFAVWVARRDLALKHPEGVARIYRCILESKAWGSENRAEIIKEARRRTMLSEDELRQYFSGLSYNWNQPLEKGMELYFSYARELGLLSEVRPVSFLDRSLDSLRDNRYNKFFISEME